MRMHIHEGTVRGKKLGDKQWPTNAPKLIRLLIVADGIVPVNALLERYRYTAKRVEMNHLSYREQSMGMHIHDGTVRGKKLGDKQWPTNSPKLMRLLIAADGIVPVNILLERYNSTAKRVETNHLSYREQSMRMHIHEDTVRGKKLGGKQWPTNSPKLVRLLITADGIVPVNVLLERSSTAANRVEMNH